MPKPDLVLCRGWRGVGAYAAKTLEKWTSRDALGARRAVMLVPTAAAGHLLRAQLEQNLLARKDVAFLPVIATPSTLVDDLAAQSEGEVRLVDPLLREALLRHAFERTAETDTKPPFELRGGLARRVLQLYDTLLMNRSDLDTFVTRALEELDAPDDEGAEKLARQTRFLHASLESYRSALDELNLVDPPLARHALRDRAFPFEHALVLGSETLTPLDLDFLSNAPNLRSLTIAVAENSADLPSALSVSTRAVSNVHVDDSPEPTPPKLLLREPLVARDREESLVDAVRILKQLETPPHRVAIVVPAPLPYLYLAKKVLDDASVAYELQDSFPLATEPYVAAVDLALELVATDAHRSSALALLRSPFFEFEGVGSAEVAAFDELTLRYREPGSVRRWTSLYERKRQPPTQATLPGMESREESTRVVPPLAALVEASEALAPLDTESPITDKIACLRAFLANYARVVPDPRHNRSRAAVASILERLEACAPHVGNPPIDFQTFREQLRRAIEAHTFDTRSGTGGVTVVDARSAGFGSFDLVILLGINDGEWPSRGERNIFYPQWLLREFGWPSDRELLAGDRSRFRNLLDLASEHVVLLRHQLEDEIPTVASPLLEEVDSWLGDEPPSPEADALDTDVLRALVVTRSEALRRGLLEPEFVPRVRRPGAVGPLTAPDPVSPTSLELYLRCPFKYFSRYLLRLEEEEQVDEMLTPLERGRILHDLLQEGFEAWDAGSDTPRPITPESYEEALATFRDIAVKKIPPQHRRVELPRLFGGAGEAGALEWLLRWELGRGPLERRLLEYSFQSPLRLETGPRGEKPWFVQIKGRVDRADIDTDGRLHVFDYKSGRAPASAVTLQVPLYAMCLSQELSAPVHEAAYLSFRDRRAIPRADYQKASALLVDTYGSIQNGEFPPKPYHDLLCHSCGFVGVCRKEIQEDA